MIIKTEISNFDEFQAWSGGKDTLKDLTWEQKERLFEYAEQVFPEGCTDDDLNNWLWFERDDIYRYLKIDANGNEIGSVEWARSILMRCASDFEESVNSFGNIYNLITCFLDEEYDDSDESEIGLKSTFSCYVFNKWTEYAAQQLQAWHSEFGLELIKEWVDENYDFDTIDDINKVEDSFSKYVDELNELEEV